MSKILKKFGMQVREKRRDQGKSQETLAKLSALHWSYISAVERGKRNISLKNIQKICKALGIKLSDLL